MKYLGTGFSYLYDGKKFVPENRETELFEEALPNDFSLEVNVENWEEGKLTFKLPFSDGISYGGYDHLRQSARDILENKTNIPEELIEDAYRANYKRGEELAFLLRFYLEDIRLKELTGAGPNVTKTITRSEIAFYVGEMLGFLLEDRNPQLLSLTKALLNLDKSEKKADLLGELQHKKHNAFKYKVNHSELSIKDIADRIGVDRTTVSKWFSADDADENIALIKNNVARIYRYWVRHENLPLEQVASNLDISIHYLKELQEHELHATRWRIHVNFLEKGDPFISQIDQ